MKRKRKDDIKKYSNQRRKHAPKPVINGRPLESDYGDLVVTRSRILNNIKKDVIDKGKSTAVFISGAYLTGKTNLLYQLKIIENAIFLMSNLDARSNYHLSMTSLSIALIEKFPKLKQEVDKMKEYNLSIYVKVSEVLSNFEKCKDIFEGFVRPFIWCIDEGHKVTESLVGKVDVSFENFIRPIVRNTSNCFIFITTVNSNLMNMNSDTDSPYDEYVIRDLYFHLDEIQFLVKTLQGDGESRVEINKNDIEEICNNIMEQTNGHPGLCGYYLQNLYEVISEIRDGYVDETIMSLWFKSSNKEISQRFHYSRLISRMKRTIKIIYPFIQKTGILYDSTKILKYSPDKAIDECLRLGILKYGIDKDVVQISCKSMIDAICYCIRPAISRNILFFEVDGELNIDKLVRYLIHNTSKNELKNSASYVTSRIGDKSKLVPSEKMYQVIWYSILSSLCINTNYNVSHEAKITGKKKVDLLITFDNENKIKKYQIEIAANCPTETTIHSAKGHYIRQINDYHINLKHTVISAVIVIYNIPLSSYYLPQKKNEHVLYYHVTQLLNSWEPKILSS